MNKEEYVEFNLNSKGNLEAVIEWPVVHKRFIIEVTPKSKDYTEERIVYVNGVKDASYRYMDFWNVIARAIDAIYWGNVVRYTHITVNLNGKQYKNTMILQQA